MQSAAFYSVFGLRLRSELALREIPRADAVERPDVDIRLGPVAEGEAGHSGYAASADGTVLAVPRVGRYVIRDGREIVIHPAAGASERNLRLFLLGSAIGALLHQRGLLPLHANAIDLGGRAAAFSGHSGAGKSTIAAWFHDHGQTILADDVCVIGFDSHGGALAYPGIPRLRLWREALEASGRDVGAYDRSFDDLDKFDVPTAGSAELQPLPLAAVYLLHKADCDDGKATIDRLTGVDAVETLISNTYRGAYLKSIGRTGEHLAACVKVARSVPVFRASRRWGHDRFDEEAGRLRDHALAQKMPG